MNSDVAYVLLPSNDSNQDMSWADCDSLSDEAAPFGLKDELFVGQSDSENNGYSVLERIYPDDFDTVLGLSVGKYGLYQKFLVLLLCIPACFISAFATFDLIFIAYKPDFRCNVPYSIGDGLVVEEDVEYQLHTKAELEPLNSWPNSSWYIKPDQCTYVLTVNRTLNLTFQCSNWSYDHAFMDRTVVTDWNLVCGLDLESRTIWSTLNLATLVAVVYSYIQDRYGRKKAFVVNLSVYLTGSLASVLLPQNVFEFGILKFMSGITCMWDICFCWALELVSGSDTRTLITTQMSMLFGLANMSLALVAYLCRDWVLMGLSTTIPFFALYSYIWLVPESPRWLLTQNKIEDAFHIMLKMGKRQNSKMKPGTLWAMLNSLSSRAKTNESNGDSRLTVSQFFKSKNLMWKNFILTYVVVVANQLYGTIPYDSQNLYSNFYIAYLIPTAVELPATLCNVFIVNKIGRILPLSIFMLISAVCCLLTWPLESESQWSTLVLAALSRFFISAALAVQEQVSEETYPTVGRGVGGSISFGASAIAAFGIQYIVYSSVIWKVLPLLIVGFFTLLASLISLFLPDTFEKPMPDSVEKAESQGSVGLEAFWENITCASWRNRRKVTS